MFRKEDFQNGMVVEMSDFDEKTYNGEKELFQMQLEFAKELKLPVIIHSRDAFEDTLDCLKNVGYHNGIVHCYSYGKESRKSFGSAVDSK